MALFGQSNMQMPVEGWGKVKNYQQEVAQANYPNIRLMTVSNTISLSPSQGVYCCRRRMASVFIGYYPGVFSSSLFFGRK